MINSAKLGTHNINITSNLLAKKKNITSNFDQILLLDKLAGASLNTDCGSIRILLKN